MAGYGPLLCSLITAVQVAVAISATGSCYSNQTQCLSDLRQLLVDTNRFWFGSSYENRCPDGPMSSPTCSNPDPDKKSILARLLGLSDSLDQVALNETIQGIALANITYNAPAGNYTGCGQDYQVPAVTDYLVDPLNITLISSWSLSRTPTVTWTPRTQNTSHILVIWDPGNHYNHGLYVNCVGGSLDSCEVVRPYLGPLYAYLGANTYIFAAYEQDKKVDINEAMRFVEGQALLEPARFVANLTSENNIRPVHAGVLTIISDPYSVQKISDRFFIANNCPYLISQLDTFRATVAASGLSVSWSDNATTMSLYNSHPYLTSLTTNIEVRYWTEDFSVESCCSNYSITQGSFTVNPFSIAAVRPANARNKPQVQLTPMDFHSTTGIAGDTYTLFLLDVASALIPGAKNPSYVTHWLVTNIQNADVNTGDQVAQYFGPNPFNASDHRPYMFLLLRQPVAKLNNTIFSDFCPNGTMTCRIELGQVLTKWNLTEIVGLTWFLAEQDAFARYRIYSVLKARTKATVCQGLSGYGDPCPSPCPSNKNNNGVPHRMSAAVIVCLLAFVSNFGRIL